MTRPCPPGAQVLTPPLTFLSSAFMAPSQMPSWMRHVADFNPVWLSIRTFRSYRRSV